MIVWIPMLDGDELPAAQKASEAFRDRAIPQFWDGARRLGHEVARSLGAEEWTAWDIYLFYPPGAIWTDGGLPRPAAVLVQAGGVVIATKGTLPAVELPAHLPAAIRDRVDIVGPQSEIGALLARVATPFAQRYAVSSGSAGAVRQ